MTSGGAYREVLRVPRRACAHRCQRCFAARRLALQRGTPRIRLQRDGFGRLGRRGHDLPTAAVRAARTGRRNDRRPLRPSHRAARPATSLRCALMLGLAAVVAADGPVALVIALTALASVGGSGGAAGGDGAAAAARRGVAPRPGERPAAHGAGSRCRGRPGDRRGPARRRAALGGVRRQRRHVRRFGGADLDASLAPEHRRSGGPERAPPPSSATVCTPRAPRGSSCRSSSSSRWRSSPTARRPCSSSSTPSGNSSSAPAGTATCWPRSDWVGC